MFYGSVAERWGEGIVLLSSTIGYLGMQILDMLICTFIPMIQWMISDDYKLQARSHMPSPSAWYGFLP
jgi:hypothetical protein